MAARQTYRKRTAAVIGGLSSKPNTASRVNEVSRTMPTAAQRRARAVDIGSQARTHETTRGKRRLTAEQAYLRRTTDSSRARAAKLYGLSAGQVARLNREAGLGDRKLPSTPSAPKPNGPQNLGRGNLAQNLKPSTGGVRTGARRRRRRPSTGGVTAPY